MEKKIGLKCGVWKRDKVKVRKRDGFRIKLLFEKGLKLGLGKRERVKVKVWKGDS